MSRIIATKDMAAVKARYQASVEDAARAALVDRIIEGAPVATVSAAIKAKRDAAVTAIASARDEKAIEAAAEIDWRAA